LDHAFLVGEAAVAHGVVGGVEFLELDPFDGGVEGIGAAVHELHRQADAAEGVVGADGHGAGGAGEDHGGGPGEGAVGGGQGSGGEGGAGGAEEVAPGEVV